MELQYLPQRDADHIAKPANEARAAAEALINDERYSCSHKQAEIARLRDDAIAAVEKAAQVSAAQYEAMRDAGQKAAYVSLAPPADQAAQHLFLRDALDAKFERATPNDVYTYFESILAAGDTVAARVMYAHALQFATSAAKSGKHDQTIVMTSRIDALQKQALDLIATPDQRAAREKVTKSVGALNEIKRVKDNALVLVRGMRLESNGRLMTAMLDSMPARL